MGKSDIGNNVGLVAVRRLARKLDPEPGHAFQVCRNALELFDATRSLHGLGRPARRLLGAAALLHDIGHTIDVVGHHKHSRDLILNMELPEFTRREKCIVACVARYHRKAHPSSSHATFCDLKDRDRRLVEMLAAILRIADGLDRSHRASCRHVRVRQDDTQVAVIVDQRKPNPTDIWGAVRKRRLFEDVFHVKVVIQASSEALPRPKETLRRYISSPDERHARGFA
ncbi:MAG: HD domain-containing protein [Candidatus Hydrogenedentes bacterium]|nr:HD domain-containing protein [Candidatus Hydrogenedentota bacterium]